MSGWKWIALVAGISISYAHTTAHAGGLAPGGVPDAAYTSNYGWEGFGLGVSVGAGAFVFDGRLVDFTDGDVTDTDGLGGEGFSGDIFVTYDRIVHENYVLGGQIEASYSNISSESTITDSDGTTTLDWGPAGMFSILGRVGHILNESTMVYGLIGWTHAEFDLDVATTDPTYSSDGTGNSSHDGISLGVGLETMILENTSMRVEYRYTDFDSTTFVDPDDGDTLTVEPSMHVGRVGVVRRY